MPGPLIQKLLIGDMKNFRQSSELNIRDETLTALNALDCILIHIKPLHLEHVGKFSLGNSLHAEAELADLLTAYII